jgi:hypothetical protein
MNSCLRSSRELLGDEFRFQKLSGASGRSIEVSEALESFWETNLGFRSFRELLGYESRFEKRSDASWR